MRSNTCTIIIPTNDKYLDICQNFVEVLRMSWSECPYRVIISVYGENKNYQSKVAEILYNEDAKTITSCVYKATKLYNSNMYMVFLGDAFFSKKIDNKEVEKIIDSFQASGFEYCMLRPRKAYDKIRPYNKMIRYIGRRDRYNHSFIAFMAKPEFIEKEFSNPMINDFDFESKYLDEINDCKKNIYYEKHAILRKNIFHIMPGIEKGKWDRIVLRKLKREYPSIEFATRQQVSINTELILLIRRVLIWAFPNCVRVQLKRIYNTMFGKGPFITKN